jgi:hypothetical protein
MHAESKNRRRRTPSASGGPSGCAVSPARRGKGCETDRRGRSSLGHQQSRSSKEWLGYKTGWTRLVSPVSCLLSPVSYSAQRALCLPDSRLMLQHPPRQLRLSPKRGTTRSGLEWHSLMLRDDMLRLQLKVDRVVRLKSRIPISLPRYPRLPVPCRASQHRGYGDQSDLGYLQLLNLKPHRPSTASAVHPHRPSLERTLRPW